MNKFYISIKTMIMKPSKEIYKKSDMNTKLLFTMFIKYYKIIKYERLLIFASSLIPLSTNVECNIST